MSGPENFRGVDYQVTTSVLLVLQALVSDRLQVESIQIDSLDDDGEDLGIVFSDGRAREIQLKKLSEGYNWTVARLAPILRRFSALDVTTECSFVTDGSAARAVIPLRHYLEGTGGLTGEIRDALERAGLPRDDLAKLEGRVRLETRFFPSPDEADPAARVRLEVDRTLVAGPFSLTRSAAEIRNSLWADFFAATKAGRALGIDELLELLGRAGVSLTGDDWAVYPTADRYYAHEVSVDEIIKKWETAGIALILAVGGGGKTTLAAEAATKSSNNGQPVFWFTASALNEPEDFVGGLADYLARLDENDHAAVLRGAEPVSQVAATTSALKAVPARIVVDRFEGAGMRLQRFIEEVLLLLGQGGHRSGIVLTTRVLPRWWPDLAGATRLNLGGLPIESSIELLEDAGVCSGDECHDIVSTTGGHPQSLNLLAQVAQPVTAEDLEGGIEAARDWLLRRVLDELPDVLRTGLSRVAAFDYQAPRRHAVALLGPNGPDVLRALATRDLIRISAETLTVHDAIRLVAFDLLGPAAKQDVHRDAAAVIRREMGEQYERDDFVLFEKSLRWAAHLEKAGSFESLGGRYPLILNADGELLRALYSVKNAGFPFEFDDPSLGKTWDFAEDLETRGIIEVRPANDGKDVWVEPPFQLSGFDFFEGLLIESLCLTHGHGASLGYLDVMKPNYSFQWQGIVCPWEHCIELSPLPSMSRDESEASLERDRKRLEGDDLKEEHRKILEERVAEGVPDWVVDEPDLDLRARSCPIFGHACPGGKEQADTCRENDERFEWAVPPDGWEG